MLNPATWPRWLQLLIAIPHVILGMAAGITGWTMTSKSKPKYIGGYFAAVIYLVVAWYLVLQKFTIW